MRLRPPWRISSPFPAERLKVNLCTMVNCSKPMMIAFRLGRLLFYKLRLLIYFPGDIAVNLEKFMFADFSVTKQGRYYHQPAGLLFA